MEGSLGSDGKKSLHELADHHGRWLAFSEPREPAGLFLLTNAGEIEFVRVLVGLSHGGFRGSWARSWSTIMGLLSQLCTKLQNR